MDFTQVKNIAVVGISDNPERDSHRVARYLQEEGYRVIPVNPNLQEVLGETCYPDLLSIPEGIPVDVVDIFRRSDQVEPIVEQAIKRGAKVVWMQLRVINEEAAARAREAGLEVIMNRCIMVEHGKWAGGRH
ncbi:CoA-binding protein [Clostridiales bacterium PH28_bin88]|nr:CoA-binding protein [Clostridiales bacterium PH28_bin88]